MFRPQKPPRPFRTPHGVEAQVSETDFTLRSSSPEKQKAQK